MPPFFLQNILVFSWKLILVTLSLWHRNENAFPPNPMVFQKKEDAPLALGRLYGEAMAKFV
jgi:hypothetical protein